MRHHSNGLTSVAKHGCGIQPLYSDGADAWWRRRYISFTTSAVAQGNIFQVDDNLTIVSGALYT